MTFTAADISRRAFLKAAGLGSLAIGLAPWLELNKKAKRGQINIHFLAASDAQVVDGVHHRMLMGGCGHVTRGTVVANGSFQHQNASGAIPQAILGEGSWKAKRLKSFTLVGTHGKVGVAGVLLMDVLLIPEDGPKVAAELEVVCNIPPAGLFTGKPEGYKLTIPGAPFGPFEPLGPPPLGITWFTNGVEQNG